MNRFACSVSLRVTEEQPQEREQVEIIRPMAGLEQGRKEFTLMSDLE